jgi:hypothetical protein
MLSCCVSSGRCRLVHVGKAHTGRLRRERRNDRMLLRRMQVGAVGAKVERVGRNVGRVIGRRVGGETCVGTGRRVGGLLRGRR